MRASYSGLCWRHWDELVASPSRPLLRYLPTCRVGLEDSGTGTSLSNGLEGYEAGWGACMARGDARGALGSPKPACI